MSLQALTIANALKECMRNHRNTSETKDCNQLVSNQEIAEEIIIALSENSTPRHTQKILLSTFDLGCETESP